MVETQDFASLHEPETVMEKGEIILYQPDNSIELEVRMEAETVWLNRQQMALLFNRDVKTIGKHINNALTEELRDFSTVAKFAIVQRESNVHFLHIGASLKDLGKKLFAFSKLEISPEVILNVISKTEVS